MRLLNGEGYNEFIMPEMLLGAVKIQLNERFEITSKALGIGKKLPTITKRERKDVKNTTLNNSFEIAYEIMLYRAVTMLVLRPRRKSAGHAVLFSSRLGDPTKIVFFDPNYGWFEYKGAPMGVGFFINWFDRYYNASFYKQIFEHGTRELVAW